MTTPESSSPEPIAPPVSWSPVIAGAVAASALSFVLLTFGAALGLSVASPSPTWRDASVGLAFLSGVFVLLTAVVSFGVGGYVAGRLRARRAGARSDEVEFWDGIHGLLVWGFAVTFAAFLAAATTSAVVTRALPGGGSSVEPAIAYDLDRLLRTDRPAPADAETYGRAEAGRIALAASGRQPLAPDDRTYLVQLVSKRTGVAQPEAERRVEDFITRATRAIRKARRSAVVVGFLTGAALLLSAVVAWAAAEIGGRERDGVEPLWEWSNPTRTS